MRVEDLQYDLPPERIAQQPAERRDASRLLVIDRASGQRRHETFTALPQVLPPGALLVLNDTRVLPARLRLRRRTGGRVEALFLHEPEVGTWEVMVTKSGRLRAGEVLNFESSPQQLTLVAHVEAGTWRAQPVPPGNAHALLAEYGRPPLPPYIKRAEGERGRGGEGETEGSEEGSGFRVQVSEEGSGFRVQGSAKSRGLQPARSADSREETALRDAERYQTIYARSPGAVAAPTAGLHFTREVFEALAAAGMSTTYVTLHVGVGTFAPIRCPDLADHPMHAEWYECPEVTAAAVKAARQQGRKIVAVGTTSVRVLESCADEAGIVRPGSGWTRLFIYPPYHFKAVDAMVTNFHLPGSTLLAMVFAFAGRETILGAYAEAIQREYRFYSYGDAMVIL